MARSLSYASGVTLLFTVIFPFGRIFRPDDSDTTKLLAVIRGGSGCYICSTPFCCSCSDTCDSCFGANCGQRCTCACGLEVILKQTQPQYLSTTCAKSGETGRTCTQPGSPSTIYCLNKYLCLKCVKKTCGSMGCQASSNVGVPVAEKTQSRAKACSSCCQGSL